MKRIAKRVLLNFKQSYSDRKSIASYRAYHGRVKRLFVKAPKFSKINKENIDK